MNSDWKSVRAGGGDSRVWWRRRLPDGSYLSVTCEPGRTEPLPWVWRHRGPQYDRRRLGTVINAQGRASNVAGAREAADRYAGTLTGFTEQTALEV